VKESSWSEETRRLGKLITAEEVGVRLDEYLSSSYRFFSRSAWQREIKWGHVLVNGILAKKPSYRLQLADDIRRLHPLYEEPDVDLNLRLIWSNDHIAAVYKPPGLPMHESGYYRRKTVAGILPSILGPHWTPVHRLDRETSGLLLCAKTPNLRAKLTSAWTNREVEKSYLAIITDHPSSADFAVNLPIKADRYERTNRATVDPDGDEACTLFRVLAKGKASTLLEARPLTGRTNQIRVHLHASGLYLFGDKVYGPNPNILDLYRKEGNSLNVQTLAGFPRHALHAWRLKFKNPDSNEVIELECPLADDLKTLCEIKNIDHTVSFSKH
jgi:23S rRNA pseudouridine1911/1915/1917 synthase